jgi:hypothetical protein
LQEPENSLVQQIWHRRLRLVERAGEHDHDPGPDRPVLAAAVEPLLPAANPLCTSESASTVVLAPQSDSLDPKIIEAPLPPGASDFTVRALETTPARETLMFSIMRNATAPAGCVSDLERFKH